MGTPNWDNRTLFHGDNLKFMRAMNSESVDLIATDPPFNKGRDFHATPDSLADGAKFQDRWSWEQDVHEEWVDQISDDYPHVMHVIQGSRSSYGDDMGAFLCFMAVRLIAMRRLLKPTGSIYLHCDPAASHYLKELMDAVFGRANFRNEIAWMYTGRLMVGKKRFNSKHDLILFYSKSNKHKINPITEPIDKNDYLKMKKQKVHTDNEGRDWIWGHAGKGKSHEYRIYLDEVVSKGKAVSAEWFFPIINTSSKERTGYPTQKPLNLYGRIIEASSKEDDVVLDPFAGCATTLVAAEKLGRKWVGIDLWEKSSEVVVNRLQQEGLLGGSQPQGGKGQGVMPLHGDLTFTSELPERTDDGETAVPYLRPKVMVKEPEGPKYTRHQMYEHLLDQKGPKCQGCDRVFDDPRYLELDHNTPRSDGGLNHISNRVLLCGPCNRLKSNKFTLSGLRSENMKRGFMADQD
ncbi:MAG: DNA methyltransferase [Gemmatimonadetes bacterium]|nr:DNA methyltransferase [Gemmatimonadota bacterium]